MDLVDQRLLFLGATHQKLDLRALFHEIHGADQSVQLSLGCCAYPDVDPASVHRGGVLQISVVYGIDEI